MPIPETYSQFLHLTYSEIQALCDEIISRKLTANNIEQWLADYSQLGALFQERMARLDITTQQDTEDNNAHQQFQDFRTTYLPIIRNMEKSIAQKLDECKAILPDTFKRAWYYRSKIDALYFNPDSAPLYEQEAQLTNQYNHLLAKQTIPWQGQNLTKYQAKGLFATLDRPHREQLWRTMYELPSEDIKTLKTIWKQLYDVRQQLAHSNGYDTYLQLRWEQFGRTDYTPKDSQHLREWLKIYWLPHLSTALTEQCQQLQLNTLRPWDVDHLFVDSTPIKFATPDDLFNGVMTILEHLDTSFTQTIRQQYDTGMIDLAQRKNTAQVGGFSRAFGREGNFILLNVTGTHADMINLIHEIGHSLALQASCKLPYQPFWGFPTDFSETPSTTLEMLSIPYWDAVLEKEAVPAIKKYYFVMGMLYHTMQDCIHDAFQHWMHTDPQNASDWSACNIKLQQLIHEFLPDINWTDLGSLIGINYLSPAVYYPLLALEYTYGRIAGLHLLSLPHEEAIKRYKSVISKGNQVSAPELFQILGVNFPFTEQTIRQLDITQFT